MLIVIGEGDVAGRASGKTEEDGCSICDELGVAADPVEIAISAAA
jgi:hypothetical protein